MDDQAKPMLDAASSAWATTRDRATQFREWRRRLLRELSELPDTMERLRNGAASFELVGQRLEKSSATIAEVAEIYQSTVIEPGRRSAQALDELRTQVDALATATGAPEQISTSAAEVQRAFEALADMSPFWPRQRRRGDPTP